MPRTSTALPFPARRHPHHRHHRSCPRGSDGGTALILSLFFSIVVTGLVITGSIVIQANAKKTESAFRLNSQAMQFADSGLIEAQTWFRRQTSQPVMSFEPKIDTSVSPPVFDTDDPEIGIMREFQISGPIWGRYEVWKEWGGDPDPVRLLWRQQMQARDTSAARGLGIPGTAWRLRSIGYVFRRTDPNARFDELPNHVIAQRMREAEILRLIISPPGQSAVNVRDGNNCHVNTNGRIRGGATGAGIFYPQGSGTPTTGPVAGNRVTGTPALAPSATYDDSVRAVFGVSYAELKGMATDIITDPANFPVPVPTNSIIIVESPTVKFDSSLPLSGTGLVFIKGKVSILPGSNSVFNGLLYIDGGFDMRAPADISGSVVVTGNMTLQGVGDYATIYYDEDVLNSLRQAIGNYRLLNAIRPVLPRE